jgi:hypothetical protein
MKGEIMKKLLTALAMLLVFFVGCSDQSSITEPTGSATNAQTSQYKEPNWLVSLPSSSLGVETVTSASKLCDGSKDNQIYIDKHIPGGPYGEVHVQSTLVIKKNSFSGFLTISTSIDDQNLTTTFGPSYVFNQPLEYTLQLEGVDLRGVDPKTVDFVYQSADGSIHTCQHDQIEFDFNNGRIKVQKALIPHFSRYGFVN